MVSFSSTEEVLKVKPVYKAHQRRAIVLDLKSYMDSTEMIKKEGITQNQTKTQTQQLSSVRE